MQRYTCPTAPAAPDGTPHTVIGCGASFEAAPDDEGLVDCPKCGIWFHPEDETFANALRDALKQGVKREDIDPSWFDRTRARQGAKPS